VITGEKKGRERFLGVDKEKKRGGGGCNFEAVSVYKRGGEKLQKAILMLT